MKYTQYELTGNWTTTDEGDIFLQEVASETGAKLDVIGLSYRGKNIYRLTVGNGDRLLVVTGGVHRSEPASRELTLIKARDVAYDLDGKYSSYLSNHTIMFIPTVQPDIGTTRENAQGLNINRDAYSLRTPEMIALMRVIADEHPDIYVDFHERSGSAYQVEFINTMAHDPNSDIKNNNASTNMVNYIRNELETKGYATAPYPIDIIGPGMTISAAGLLGSVSMTPETYVQLDDSDFRITALGEVFDLILEWHVENKELIDEVKSTNLKPNEAFTLLNGNNEYYVNATRTDIITPKGYVLENPSEFELWKDVYNIYVDESGFVPIEQRAGRMIPHLLDPQSDMAVTAATRVEPEITVGNGRMAKVLYEDWKDVFIKNFLSREDSYA